MNALALHGPGDLRHEQVGRPEAPAGSVVVRVVAAPIWDYVRGSCDANIRRSQLNSTMDWPIHSQKVLDGSLRFPHAYPPVFGTRCVGRVDEVGPDVCALRPGQLVFCGRVCCGYVAAPGYGRVCWEVKELKASLAGGRLDCAPR